MHFIIIINEVKVAVLLEAVYMEEDYWKKQYIQASYKIN